LGGVDCPDTVASEGPGAFTLQNWLINITALCINQAVVPEVEAIHYSLDQATPPFWCYVEQALDRLPAVERLITVMAITFRWSENRIAAYLQAEGESLTAAEVRQKLSQTFQHLEASLPEDIRQIYLGGGSLRPEPLPDDLDGLLNVPDLGGPELVGVNLVGTVGELSSEWAN
jgi:hypothetical protein